MCAKITRWVIIGKHIIIQPCGNYCFGYIYWTKTILSHIYISTWIIYSVLFISVAIYIYVYSWSANLWYTSTSSRSTTHSCQLANTPLTLVWSTLRPVRQIHTTCEIVSTPIYQSQECNLSLFYYLIENYEPRIGISVINILLEYQAKFAKMNQFAHLGENYILKNLHCIGF